jgi:hypothetical protein
MNRRGIAGNARGFNGNFASLFTPGTILQSVQTDLGLTYGGTPLATAGNTSTTVLTLSGALTTVPVPILAKSTNTASLPTATFNLYADGGTTPFMTGVTPTAGVGVPLTGPATGLTMTWAAGTGVTNDTWNATCATLADQVGAANLTQGTPAAQPIIATGLNGHASITTNGTTQFMLYTLDLPAPLATNIFVWWVGRLLASPAVAGALITDAVGACEIFVGAAASTLTMACPTSVNTTAAGVGNWGNGQAFFSDTTGDSLKFGAPAATTGANAGNADSAAARAYSAVPAGTNKLSYELLALLTMNAKPSVAQLANAIAVANAFYATALG